MLSSVLRYPKIDRFVRIHESLVVACENNICAAALITFFEGWHNYKLAQKPYTGIYNEMAEQAGYAPVIDTSGWQYHTNPQLEAGVMIYKIGTINPALDYLEKREFISTDVPERLVMLHKTGRTRWFLLRADKINEWFNQYEQNKRPTVRTLRPKRERKEVVKVSSEDARLVFRFWKVRCNHPRSIADPDRLLCIEKMLKVGFTVNDLCMVVEGCLASAWHQGENDRNRVYDGIDLIFRSAKHVEQLIDQAYDAGVKPERVQELLDAGLHSLSAGSPVGPTKPVDETRVQSILKTALPFLLNDDWGSNHVRPLKVLLEGKVETLIDLGQRLVDRVEASEGIYTAEHRARFDRLIQELTNDR